MKHPHHDLITEWVKDTSRIVQWSKNGSPWINCTGDPSWSPNVQFRFKPRPKPDVAREASVRMVADSASFNWYSSNPNVRFIFDGETNELKSIEMIK